MGMEYKLNSDSKIMLIKRGNNKVGVYKKGNIVDVSDSIIDLTDKEGTFLEEISTDEKNKVKLVEIKPYVCQSYILRLIDIDLSRLINFPEKVSDNFYMFKDREKELCFVDITGNLIPFEKMIRKTFSKYKNLDIGNIDISSIDDKKVLNGYFITIELGSVDTLHILLKIDDKIEVFNNFYSEMADGAEFSFYDFFEKDRFIRIEDFYLGLVHHAIIDDIEFVSNYENDCVNKRKSKIKERVLSKF